MKKDLYAYFWEAYPEVPPRYEEVFEVVQSDAAFEKFNSAIGLGELLEKPEGEDLQSDAPIESYTIVCKNTTYGRLVRFSYETVQDVKKMGNIVLETAGTWGSRVPDSKEKFYAKFFNNGHTTAGHSVFNNTVTGVVTDSSGDKIYDSKSFFNTAHEDKVGGSYSNYSATNSLTHGNLQTVYNTYTSTNNRDERGERIALMPDVLLIPPALGFTAKAILQSSLIPSSMDNDINVVRNLVEPLEWSYLTDTDSWFLGRRREGLMATDRQDVHMDFWQDETNLDYFASIYTRWGGCVTNWRNNCVLNWQQLNYNRMNCGKSKSYIGYDNPQPSLSNESINKVDRKVQRLISEDGFYQ